MIPEPDQVDDSHETRACGPDAAAALFADSRVLVMDTPPRDVAGEMTAPERLIGSDVGGYRIKRVIASGGMGTVYLASQQTLDRIVALKVMSSYIGSATARPASTTTAAQSFRSSRWST
jgi:serine/threonine protein kinase